MERDEFYFSIGKMTIETPYGLEETIEVTGPVTVAVYFEGAVHGTAFDDPNDVDTLDEVVTEIVALDLTGMSSVGPVHVGLNPDIPSRGEIEDIHEFDEKHGSADPDRIINCHVCHTVVRDNTSSWPHEWKWNNSND